MPTPITTIYDIIVIIVSMKEIKNEGSRIAPAKQKRPSLICHLLQMMVGWSRCQIEQVLISPLSLWLGKNINIWDWSILKRRVYVEESMTPPGGKSRQGHVPVHSVQCLSWLYCVLG